MSTFARIVIPVLIVLAFVLAVILAVGIGDLVGHGITPWHLP